jgi:ssDNA-binding Zn-finger/Zn-ribbon topoisomerase 1
MPEPSEPVEVVCPKCQRTEIVYIPKESIPNCPDCRTPMVLRELLREGKSY